MPDKVRYVERMTGIEPALSAWERDSGSPELWLCAQSSWFYVVELRRSGVISYTASYTDEAGAPPPQRARLVTHRTTHDEASTVVGGELVRPGIVRKGGQLSVP